MSCRPAPAHQNNAADNQHGCQHLLPAEVIHAHGDAHDGGQDGLQVGVQHACKTERHAARCPDSF